MNAAVEKAQKKAGTWKEPSATVDGTEPMAESTIEAAQPKQSEAPMDAGMEALAAEAANFQSKKKEG